MTDFDTQVARGEVTNWEIIRAFGSRGKNYSCLRVNYSTFFIGNIMSMILKSGKTFKDSTSAEATTGYYGTVKELHRVDWENKRVCFWFKVYRNKAASTAKVTPVFKQDYMITGDVFDAVLGIDNLNLLNNNIIKALYVYVLGVRTPSTYTVDEETQETTEVLGDLTWGDWETDEI